MLVTINLYNYATDADHGGNMADIFRKSSLDKLSSPEQLDKAITIISPSFWIAAIGGGFIIAVALIWSIFGRLPVNVNASGIYMGHDGMHAVVAEADGIVQEIFVSEGDTVTTGQKIAQLDDEVYQTELETLTARRDDVEAVTFYSYGDPATADTKPLLDIKAQADVSGTALSADQIALKERNKALSSQRGTTKEAKSAMNSAEGTLKNKQNEYVSLQKEYKKAQEDFTQAETTFTNYVQVLGAAGIDVTDTEKIEGILKAKIDDLQAQIDAILAADPPGDTSVLEATKRQYEDYLKQFQDYKKKRDDALSEVDRIEAAAKKKELEVGNAQSDYNTALSTYNQEKATQKSLQDTVSQLEAKVKGDKTGKNNQMSALEEQFTAAKGSILDQLNQEITKQSRAADAMVLTSRVDGKVSGLNIAKGNAVGQGTTICKITSTADESTGVICYVPVSEGKKIKAGMKVVVYPSTVNKQEYGHMEGTVNKVSSTVVSAEDMQNQLGDASLVQSFQQYGAVVRVVCGLTEDKNTASGYKWSSKKGAEVTLEEGTVVTADIVTEEKAPITMLIPYIKEKLSVDHTPDPNNQNNNNGN